MPEASLEPASTQQTQHSRMLRSTAQYKGSTQLKWHKTSQCQSYALTHLASAHFSSSSFSVLCSPPHTLPTCLCAHRCAVVAHVCLVPTGAAAVSCGHATAIQLHSMQGRVKGVKDSILERSHAGATGQGSCPPMPSHALPCALTHSHALPCTLHTSIHSHALPCIN